MKKNITYEELFKRLRAFRRHDRIIVLVFVILLVGVYFIANSLLTEYESVQPIHAVQTELERIREGDYWLLIRNAGENDYADMTQVELYDRLQNIIPGKELTLTVTVSTTVGEEAYMIRLDGTPFARMILTDSGEKTTYGFRIPVVDRIEIISDIRIIQNDMEIPETVMISEPVATLEPVTTLEPAIIPEPVNTPESAVMLESAVTSGSITSFETAMTSESMVTPGPVSIPTPEATSGPVNTPETAIGPEAEELQPVLAAEEAINETEEMNGDTMAGVDGGISDIPGGNEGFVEDQTDNDEPEKTPLPEEVKTVYTYTYVAPKATKAPEPVPTVKPGTRRGAIPKNGVYTILVPEESHVTVNDEELTDEAITQARVDTFYNACLLPGMEGLYDTQYTFKSPAKTPVVHVTDKDGRELCVDRDGSVFTAKRRFETMPEDRREFSLMVFRKYCAYFCNNGDSNSCYYVTESDSNAWNMIFEYSKWKAVDLMGKVYTDIEASDYIPFADDFYSVRVTGHLDGYIREPGDTSCDIDYVFFMHNINGAWKVYDLIIF